MIYVLTWLEVGLSAVWDYVHRYSREVLTTWLLSIIAVEEYGEHFERKELVPRPASLSSRKSALSLQLEEFDQNVNNPFMDYAKFDGRVSNLVDRVLSICNGIMSVFC